MHLDAKLQMMIMNARVSPLGDRNSEGRLPLQELCHEPRAPEAASVQLPAVAPEAASVRPILAHAISNPGDLAWPSQETGRHYKFLPSSSQEIGRHIQFLISS